MGILRRVWRRLKGYNGHRVDHAGWADLTPGEDCYCWKKCDDGQGWFWSTGY